jgi:hypothetical protein
MQVRSISASVSDVIFMTRKLIGVIAETLGKSGENVRLKIERSGLAVVA